MTLKEIRSMFAVGQQWNATRTGKALTINGNLGSTVVPANNATSEAREVVKVGSVDVVWKRSGSDLSLYTKWPKASEVLEARDGFLKFQYDNGVIVELTRNVNA